MDDWTKDWCAKSATLMVECQQATDDASAANSAMILAARRLHDASRKIADHIAAMVAKVTE